MGLKQIADALRPRLPQALRSGGARLLAWPENRRFEAASRAVRIEGGYRRIYCFHVRKTAGTSLHRAFLSASGGDGAALHERMLASLNTRIIHNGIAYAGQNRTVIEAGHYFYAYSHRPWHELNLPEATFRITVLRDPVDRVVSHYRMLIGLRETGEDPKLIANEGRWLGESIDDFVRLAPRTAILGQLSMFSEQLDVAQAVDRLQQLEFVFMTERFAEGLAELGPRVGLELREHRARSAPSSIEVTDAQRARIRELLAPEYEMLARLGLDSSAERATGRGLTRR
jgi:hypothetical protein